MFTYDPTTAIGQVRLLVPDRDQANAIFTDAEISAFLSLEGSDVRLAAALALETIASDQAMTLKVIKLLDLSTDGAKTSDALLKRAAELRKQSTEAPGAILFDYAEMVLDDFSLRQKMDNEVLRGG